MQIRPDQLTTRLNKGLDMAYWLTGDDPLLVGEAQDQLRQMAREQGFSERQVYHADATFSPDELFQSTQSMSLFGDKTLIELRVPGKITEPVRKILPELLQSLTSDHLLIITSGKIEGASKKAKWFTQLEKQVTLVQFWPLERHQLPDWLTQRAAGHGLVLDKAAADFIADKVDGNLLAASQELQKLSIRFPGGQIGFEQVSEAISDSSRWNIFDLSNALLAGQTARALRILSGLRAEGTEATLVLWALVREARKLGVIQEQLSRGMPENQVFRSQQVWDKQKKSVQNALHRLSPRAIKSALLQAAEIDQTIKGQRQGDVWSMLQVWVMSLSGNGLWLQEPGIANSGNNL